MSVTTSFRQDDVRPLPRIYMREPNSLNTGADNNIANTANRDLLKQFRLDLAELELRDTRLRLLSGDDGKESAVGGQPSSFMLCRRM